MQDPHPLGVGAELVHVGGDERFLALTAEAKVHQATEELRLGYVAFTRAKHELWVSSYQWSPTRLKPLLPSPYQLTVRETLEALGHPPGEWREPPDDHATNPLHAETPSVPWPVTTRTAEHERRLVAAELVRAAMVEPDAGEEHLDLLEASQVEEWDAELDRLLTEARADRSDVVRVPLPSSLSATQVTRLRQDPEQLAADLARPMPRQPSPAARFGTLFHAWVEARFGQQALLDPDDLPGRADLGIDDADDLRELIARFEAGPFADRVPVAVEPSFALVLGGQVVRGRIDAVYDEPDGGFLLVDWKTNRQQDADPWQLAIYRLAWAELTGTPVERVRAAFHYVRTGATVEPADLGDRAAIERLVLGEDDQAV